MHLLGQVVFIRLIIHSFNSSFLKSHHCKANLKVLDRLFLQKKPCVILLVHSKNIYRSSSSNS